MTRLSAFTQIGITALGLSCVTYDKPGEKLKADDSGYAGVQDRGASVMGVDQYTSQHVFESLPDGGRIVLERDDLTDTAAVRAIQAHMRDIERAFRAGDFNAPFQVHALVVPGTGVMAEKRAVITYVASDLPRGGQLRVTSRDAGAVAAVHQFLAFQRTDHRAVGHETHKP